jgi:hypothetical protein
MTIKTRILGFFRLYEPWPRSLELLFKRLRNCLALVALPTLVFAGAHASVAVSVLKNFMLIDGAEHAPEANSALIIGDNGRIFWIGRVTQFNQSTGAKTVNLTGNYVCPA